MEQILTVLAGQPNCGKSTIFNMLTGARQYVANYPGVTVEKKAGSFVCGDTRVELVDLPGTYSLASWSPEEMAARQFIVEEDPAQIVAVLDASTLEKSLYLCLQLLEMRRPTLAVLNMMDVAAKRGIRVDADALSQALGIPVIRAQASKGPAAPARGQGLSFPLVCHQAAGAGQPCRGAARFRGYGRRPHRRPDPPMPRVLGDAAR